MYLNYYEKLKIVFKKVEIKSELVIINKLPRLKTNCLGCKKELICLIHSLIFLCKKCSQTGIFNPRYSFKRCLMCQKSIKGRYQFCSPNCSQAYKSNSKEINKEERGKMKKLFRRSRARFRYYGAKNLPLEIIKAQVNIEMGKECLNNFTKKHS